MHPVSFSGVRFGPPQFHFVHFRAGIFFSFAPFHRFFGKTERTARDRIYNSLSLTFCLLSDFPLSAMGRATSALMSLIKGDHCIVCVSHHMPLQEHMACGKLINFRDNIGAWHYLLEIKIKRVILVNRSVAALLYHSFFVASLRTARCHWQVISQYFIERFQGKA